MAYRYLKCECGQRMRVAVDMLGQKGRCFYCGRSLIVTEENAPIREDRSKAGSLVQKSFPVPRTRADDSGGAVPPSCDEYSSPAEVRSLGGTASDENIRNVIIVLLTVIACLIPVVNLFVILALLQTYFRPAKRFKLVLRRFFVSETPVCGRYAMISGRQAGLIHWFLTLLGLSDEFTFQVTEHAVAIVATSLAGKVQVQVPLTSVASTICGYQKSIPALFLGGIFSSCAVVALFSLLMGSGWHGTAGSSGLAMLALGFSLSAFLCFVYFLLNKDLLLMVESAGGRTTGLLFKPSIIENFSVDMAQAQRITDIINETTIQAQFPALDHAKNAPVQPHEE